MVMMWVLLILMKKHEGIMIKNIVVCIFVRRFKREKTQKRQSLSINGIQLLLHHSYEEKIYFHLNLTVALISAS